MVLWKRAAGFGILSWLIPFATSFALFPLKSLNAPLFATVLFLVVLATAGALFLCYFRNRPARGNEALGVGAMWTAINLILDYPMFAYGPMKMTALHYYSEIGLVYLAYPIFAFFAARLVRR